MLSRDKLTEVEITVADDEGCDCVMIIFGTVMLDLSPTNDDNDVGDGLRETSGDGERLRQFLSHKSGVMSSKK